MLTLFQFPTYWGLPNVSPFCLKLETYLRLAGVPYTARTTANLRRSPTGKVPFIKDGSDTVCDSSVIIDYLKNKYGDPLDKQLTLSQKAQGLALQRLIEEHFYFAQVYSRWIDPDFHPAFTATVFAKKPALVRFFVSALVRRYVFKQLWQQGMARHSRDEVYRLGKQDIDACAEMLGSKTFLFGDKPSTYDVIMYAFFEQILVPPLATPLQIALKQRPELVAFCVRMRKLAFPNVTAEKDLNYQGA